MKKFTYWRNAIVSEVYVVEAESEEAAVEMLQNGEVEVFSEEWIDWHSDNFELEHIEEMDSLYRMVKDYVPALSYFVNESGLKIDAKTGNQYCEQIR